MRSGKHLQRLILLAVAFFGGCASAQALAPAQTPAAAPPPAPSDPLGRHTPRGTVLGFLSAARKGDYEVAAQYLNARQSSGASLAEHLYVVLDRRLPPILTKLSDKPEGSQKDLADPDRDLVGTIESADGSVDISVERVEWPKSGRIWVFSKETLASIPGLYEEASNIEVERKVPKFLRGIQIGGVALFEWLALFIGLPLAYVVISLISRALGAGAARLHQRFAHKVASRYPDVLPGPLRILLLAVIIRYCLAHASLPLIARQIWSITAILLTIAGCVWLATKLTAWGERALVTRFGRKLMGGAPLLRFTRRAVDLLLVTVGAIVTLRYFGVNTTAALAGLGVGGIAIALAAQKTLENVIGGLSLIFDQTVQLGDFLKLSDMSGTVDSIGLRSTRIRTVDRTVLSVPNGQIANASLENFSARDKFRFYHVMGLEYSTSAAQLQSILGEITAVLSNDSRVETESVRVRFIRFGASSLDIELFAYLFTRDWNHFLESQQELLFQIMGVVEAAGTSIAFPSQTVYVANVSNGDRTAADQLQSERTAGRGTPG